MTVEFKDGQRERAVGMFTGLCRALSDAEVRLGAAKTRGLGKTKLIGGEITEQTLNTREGILRLLRQEAGKRVTDMKAPLHKRPRLDIVIEWHPCGPLMVKAGADGIGADSVPLVSGVEERLALVLPGSSVKGVIRNQAERILRTLLGTPLGREDDPKRRFLTHLEEVPLIEDVFGRPARERREETARSLRGMAIVLRLTLALGQWALTTATANLASRATSGGRSSRGAWKLRRTNTTRLCVGRSMMPGCANGRRRSM